VVKHLSPLGCNAVLGDEFTKFQRNLEFQEPSSLGVPYIFNFFPKRNKSEQKNDASHGRCRQSAGTQWRVTMEGAITARQRNADWYGVDCNVMTGDRTVNNCCGLYSMVQSPS